MASDVGWWGRRSGVTKAAVVAAVVLVVALVGAGLWLGGSTPDVVPTDEPVDAASRAQNTLLTNTLAAADVDVSLVDVTDERVYVAYSLPAFAYDESGGVDETAATELQRFVVGAAADAAPTADRIVIVQYDGEEPRQSWDVRMADFDAFVAGDLTLATFEERIEIERYG
jgi:hypothetical protein